MIRVWDWARLSGVRMRRIAEQIQAGIVWINTHFELRPHVPVAAQKGSGIGSKFGVDWMKSFCNSQTIWIKKDL